MMSHKNRSGNPSAQQQRSPEEKRRDRFAREMARSAFGRFYWDHKRQAELKSALGRKPKQKQK